ncbi:cathepsin D [Clonorchis sinensis]|uniref:Cathepsin D n=1 Tax=Clonorchis sinensis TaxID=79923 RepID=G7YQ03_CLOSI|nr:cathepsin D [Clonorchis sinensis]
MRFCEPCGVPTDRECRTRGNCTVIPTNVRVFGFIFPGLFKRTPKSKSMNLGDNFRATNGFFRCHRSLMENTAVLIHNWMHCNSLLSEDNTDEKTRGKSTKYHQIGGGDSSKFQRVGQRNGVIRVPNTMPHRVRRPGNNTPPIITKENRFDNSHSNDGNFPDSSLGAPSSKRLYVASAQVGTPPRSLFMSFDTGSDCTWIALGKRRSRFWEPNWKLDSKTKTLVKRDDDYRFTSGIIRGDLVQDIVKIGDQPLDKIRLLNVRTTTIHLKPEEKFDGAFGLIDPGPFSVYWPSLLTRLQNESYEAVFSFEFCYANLLLEGNFSDITQTFQDRKSEERNYQEAKGRELTTGKKRLRYLIVWAQSPRFSQWYALAKPKLHELCEILFIFTPLSFERSFSCSGVIIPANVFTLERCDWCARPIERRPSNCPGCDDRLTRQSGLPSQAWESERIRHRGEQSSGNCLFRPEFDFLSFPRRHDKPVRRYLQGQTNSQKVRSHLEQFPQSTTITISSTSRSFCNVNGKFLSQMCNNPASSSMIDGKLRRRKVMLLGATVKNSQSPNQFTTSIQEETMQFGSQTIGKRLPAVVDTGNSLTFGPREAVRKIFLQLLIPLAEYGRTYVDCRLLHTYPDLVITLGNKELRIPTRNLVIHEMHKGKQLCLFGIRYYVDDPELQWCLGLTVLRNFLTVFNKTQEANCQTNGTKRAHIRGLATQSKPLVFVSLRLSRESVQGRDGPRVQSRHPYGHCYKETVPYRNVVICVLLRATLTLSEFLIPYRSVACGLTNTLTLFSGLRFEPYAEARCLKYLQYSIGNLVPCSLHFGQRLEPTAMADDLFVLRTPIATRKRVHRSNHLEVGVNIRKKLREIRRPEELRAYRIQCEVVYVIHRWVAVDGNVLVEVVTSCIHGKDLLFVAVLHNLPDDSSHQVMFRAGWDISPRFKQCYLISGVGVRQAVPCHGRNSQHCAKRWQSRPSMRSQLMLDNTFGYILDAVMFGDVTEYYGTLLKKPTKVFQFLASVWFTRRKGVPYDVPLKTARPTDNNPEVTICKLAGATSAYVTELARKLRCGFIGQKIRRLNPTSESLLFVIGLSTLTVSYTSCFLRVSWQGDMKRSIDRRTFTPRPLYRLQLGVPTTKKLITHNTDQTFGRLSVPASTRALIGR